MNQDDSEEGLKVDGFAVASGAFIAWASRSDVRLLYNPDPILAVETGAPPGLLAHDATP